MYAPSDDSALLAECALQYRGRRALEIGVGSGIVAEALEKNFDLVAGSDIDFYALQYCKERTSAMLACCDAASAFSSKFDLIVSNPPYLPDDKVKDPAVHGGPAGVETTIKFIKSALPLLEKGGRMLVVVSSLADSSALDKFIEKEKMQKKVIKEKRLFYETLSVIELSIS
jgi:release factor glutamine methyltransferase